jgi:sugar transferase (PEP-CTERM system associated)
VRAVFIRFADHEIFKRRILVYGADKRAGEIDLMAQAQAGRSMYRVVYYLRCGKRTNEAVLENITDMPSALLPFCLQHAIDEIVIAKADRRNNMPVDELLVCKINGINIINVSDFFERETGAFRIDMLRHDSFIFSDGFKTGTMRSFFKRLFDVLFALMMLPLALLVLPVTALCILLEEGRRAAILYRQQRVGEGGKIFDILKIRSMVVDGGAEQKFAAENDARITRVGKVIRKLRIDELPQLFNVLRGDMSFVGPRPEQPTFVKCFSSEINYYNERHSVKPGITGWAQVKHSYTDDDILQTTIKLEYDLYYVKYHSLLFDLFIMIHTVEIVLLKLGPR